MSIYVQMPAPVVGDIPDPRQDMEPKHIIELVCDFYKVNMSQLQSSTRKRGIVFPRQLCMYFIRDYTKLTVAFIGDLFGGRDHTTVLHACRTVQDLRYTDKQIDNEIIYIKNKIDLL